MPVTLVQYNNLGVEIERKDFRYNTMGLITSIETYKNGKHQETAEFKTNVLGQIVSNTDYVYSSYDGKKMLFERTFLRYNPNKTLERLVKINGKDTTEINFYNWAGELTRSLWKMGGLRTTKITYIWNKDKTEMRENHYENDSTIYSTVIHKYKYKKEVEKIDPSITPKPFYWKYDSNGRIIETNEAFYYVSYCTYDLNGRIKNKTINVLFSDSDEKDLPKKIYFKYDYQVR